MGDDGHDARVAVALTHAAAEAAGDLEGTMATLDDDPTYELQPLGVKLRGRDAARRYYERFFTHCVPRITGYELRSEWIGNDGVLQEYTLQVRDPDGTEHRHAIIGVLTFGSGDRLSGERIYASPELLRFFFGPLLDDAVAA